MNQKIHGIVPEIDNTKGQHLPVERVVEKEGGWKKASSLRAGLLHFKKCFELEAPWSLRDSMTERYDVL